MNKTQQKSLNISIVGEPNAGKSTLLNSIIGHKLSIVTHKVQTTRSTLRGVFNIADTQLVFIDTPGVFDPNRPLEKYIVKNAFAGIDESDVIILIMDGKRGLSDFLRDKLLKNPAIKSKSNIIALINKVDEITQEQLFALTDQLASLNIFTEIFAISALRRLGIEQLLQHLLTLAKPGAWAYDPDILTDSNVRSIAEEITREKIFMHLHRELPYSIKVETDRWEEEEDSDSVIIYQSIFVVKKSQKSIVLGKDGSKIKTIGTQARYDIAKLLDKKVQLFLHVKVREDWMDHDFKEFS